MFFYGGYICKKIIEEYNVSTILYDFLSTQ